jgi:hypothetical protein
MALGCRHCGGPLFCGACLNCRPDNVVCPSCDGIRWLSRPCRRCDGRGELVVRSAWSALLVTTAASAVRRTSPLYAGRARQGKERA